MYKVLSIVDNYNYSNLGSFAVKDFDNNLTSALDEARGIVTAWLEGEAVPEEYRGCFCDMDFYVEALNKYDCLVKQDVMVKEIYI